MFLFNICALKAKKCVYRKDHMGLQMFFRGRGMHQEMFLLRLGIRYCIQPQVDLVIDSDAFLPILAVVLWSLIPQDNKTNYPKQILAISSHQSFSLFTKSVDTHKRRWRENKKNYHERVNTDKEGTVQPIIGPLTFWSLCSKSSMWGGICRGPCGWLDDNKTDTDYKWMICIALNET